jgi:hypothetical protein
MRTAVVLILPLALLLTSCPWAAKFRDQQVAESHKLAEGDRITPPISPPAKVGDFADDLPADKAWPVLEYSDSGGTVSAKLLSTSSSEQTIQWVDNRLHEMGYESSDNISRMLEGVTYSGKGKYSSIYVKVDMNSSDQVTVELHGTP